MSIPDIRKSHLHMRTCFNTPTPFTLHNQARTRLRGARIYVVVLAHLSVRTAVRGRACACLPGAALMHPAMLHSCPRARPCTGGGAAAAAQGPQQPAAPRCLASVHQRHCRGHAQHRLGSHSCSRTALVPHGRMELHTCANVFAHTQRSNSRLARLLIC